MNDVVAWFASVKWVPVAVASIAWLTSLTSDWSRFPLEVPDRWKPVVVMVLGQVYAVLLAILAGVPWKEAAWQGVVTSVATMGTFDLLSKAVWGDDPPPWARAWLRLFRSFSFPKKGASIPPVSSVSDRVGRE